VLLVTFELEEVLSLADRILVIYEGRIVKEFAVADADAETLGYFMTGGGGAKLGATEPSGTTARSSDPTETASADIEGGAE
ncbi:MAG: hypothetical protein CVT60_04835, partial [Actinobacteria bacterium HGW-Actinobacteria-10]